MMKSRGTVMKSVNAFFLPAVKKTKYFCEGETSQTSEREQAGELNMKRNNTHEGQSTSSQGMQGTGRNDAGNCDHWAPSPAYASELSCYSTVSTGTSNRPLPPEEEREQFLMATSCQGNYMEQIDPSLQQPHFTSPSDVGRNWHNLRRRCYHPKRSHNFTFKVVSYNVLADDLLHSNSYLYNGTEEWFKHWEYRQRNLLQELSYYNADVVCLQEVEMQHYQDWFEPKLREKGYTGLYKRRTGDKTDGCATFFKESRFTLVQSKLVSFNKPGVELMDRDNVAVVVLLKPRTPGSASRHASNMVCVSNTHLLFNKRRGDIKLAQLSCLFSEIEEIARISPPAKGGSCYHPIICCGDFNSTPFSPIYNFVVRGSLDYTGMNRDNLSGQNHFRHSYPPMYALTRNLIPWELGITTSCAKRIEPLETVGNSCSNTERRKNVQASGSRTLSVSSCHERSVNQAAQSDTSEENYTNAEIRVGNSECLKPLGSRSSVQCNPEHGKDLQSPQSSSSLLRTDTTQSQSLISMEHEEGRQTGEPSEKDVYDACTIQRHKFDFFSVYRHYFKGRQQEVTTCTFHDATGITVDYMFVSPGWRQYCRRCGNYHGPLQLTGNLDLLTESDIWYLDGQGLPNKYLSSDHLSLVASFLLHV